MQQCCVSNLQRAQEAEKLIPSAILLDLRLAIHVHDSSNPISFHAVTAPYYVQVYLNGVLWDRGTPPKFHYYPIINDDDVAVMMPPAPTVGAILKIAAIERLTGLQIVLTTDDSGTILERYDRVELKATYTNLHVYTTKLL